MKKISVLIMLICFAHFSQAQSNNYDSLWKKVTKLENDGLPKSALDVVKQIDVLAKKDNNTPQHIKVLLHKSKYALILEEDAQLQIINDFKAEIANSKAPTKNVLKNMLATLYWQYFQQNRYKFYNRTKTDSKVDETDFRTWDLQTLFNEIHTYFEQSLENQTVLQQTPLVDYDAILLKATQSKLYRPTLFDLLAHNALDFYKTDENSITKPVYKFEIDNPNLLAGASVFSKLNLVSKDSTSLQLNTIKLFQSLTAFHLNDKEPFALSHVDIERLKFVYQNATFADKEALMLKTLNTSKELYKNHKVSTLYDYEIALIKFQKGNTYNPKSNTDVRWLIKEALSICNAAIARHPKSEGAKKCETLKAQILNHSLSIISENIIPSQTPHKVLVNYKNIEDLDFHIFNVGTIEVTRFNEIYQENDKLKFIKRLEDKAILNSPIRFTLKNEDDYQTHSTELALPKLENGHYILVAKTKTANNTFATQILQVTNIASIEIVSENKNSYQIINRVNGAPLSGATVTATYQENYNSSFKTQSLISDSNGYIHIERKEKAIRNLNLTVKYQSETGYFGNYYIYQKWNSDVSNDKNYNAFLFTDRSIYRPGQTVYFKGIAIQTKNGKSEILANENVYATLHNVNDEEVGELKLKTNAFGSVSGEFILPNNGLTGNYYIEFDSESGKKDLFTEHNFSVEEYKRPKFETKFNPVTETYKVNDSVTVKGTALAYAGSNITDAKVVYRVHRKVQYPSWYYWHRPWFNSEPQEITHGESITNAKGEFEITFKAIPDESVDKSSLPIFNYEITADVTDLNGETQSATTIVNVGYHALTASILAGSDLDKTQKDHKINIDTKNLNGEFVPTTGIIKIYKLKAPKRILRPRSWAAPDYQTIPEKEFISKFPHDAYEDEQNPKNWEKGKLVLETTFDTSKEKTVELGNLKKWESGQYVILLESKDKFGQLVKDEARTTLYSDDDKTLADNQLFSITTDKTSYTANQNVLVTVGSSAENVTVTLEVEKDKTIIKTFIVPLNNNKKTIAIPVTKADVGGFAIHYSYAVFNSFESSTLPIAVPYPKTDLEIETLTFRDKLQPGADETWSFKTKGPQGDKVSAELLASMYDASLDQFKSHNWTFNPIQQPTYYSNFRRQARQSFGIGNFRVYNRYINYESFEAQDYDQLNWFGLYFGRNQFMLRGRSSDIQVVEDSMVAYSVAEEAEMDEVAVVGYGTNEDNNRNFRDGDSHSEAYLLMRKAKVVPNKKVEMNGTSMLLSDTAKFDDVVIRKNLQETAFFFPQLQTDADGNISFNFTTPEALTKWKLQLLAHTKTLESAVRSFETVTQKELMVIPNAPRFLRQGDEITISTKIANLTSKDFSGIAQLVLTDAITGADITYELVVKPIGYQPMGLKYNANEAFSINANGNTQVSWTLKIPDNVNAIQYKILAKSGDFSDGEQSALPVLTNRMLVTETLPMWIKSNETRTFTLDKLKTNTSSTLKHHKLTLEITSNPGWYAVQALPYLMEYPYDCNEQTFSRYYANALASHIANSNPRIQEVFNQWKNTDALLSNLEKNEELKNILIQETPWLRDVQSETEQKKRIALLFDMNKMKNELQSAKRKLEQNQMNNGAWAWFKGGRENRYITQHIITGFGHLKHLNVTSNNDETSIINKAIAYLDTEFVKEYKDLKKYNSKVDLSKDHLSFTQLHYLYMRSFFPEVESSKEVKDITKYYHTQIQKYWLSRSLYAKGLMALVTNRMDDKTTADKILKSLKENSITSEELGMYWKENTSSWYWYQAPIETQALLIEAFSEIENDTKTIDNLKIWLLKNKQTNQWKTTKATTEAVYALLLQGSDWLSVTEMVDVVLGGQQIEPSKLEDVKVEAGTGYYKTSWSSSEIKPEMATVELTKKGNGIAWGSLYWQYFEDLDKITSAETPLKLQKKLFKKTNTDKGEEISEITPETQLQVGDLVRVRIELRSDRAMEFIHMKDMRAAGLEPVNVLSQYKWQDGLGYYESTKDASTNFFFDYLPKGIYVFEYDLRVNNAGNMSNGITTIQSMYAPEFSGHSEGVRITVE